MPRVRTFRTIAVMSGAAWVIIVILVLPTLGLLSWAALRSSFVRVPSGSLGLVLIRGRATDMALGPGPHFVAAMRRHMVALYPSVQLSFRANGGTDTSALVSSAPTLRVMLGDRNVVTIALTVRFKILQAQLRLVHERFGPDGVFEAVRDEITRAVSRELSDADVGVKDLLGATRVLTETRLSAAVSEALLADGIELISLTLGVVDLGRTGDVVQAIARAGYELEREEAEARTRLARARNDAELEEQTQSRPEAAWRYRNPDLVSDLAQRAVNLTIAMPAESGARENRTPPTGPAGQPPSRST